MLNLVRYVKTDPATYLIQYRKGKVRRQGSGLSFFYFAPSSTLVSVPLVSVDLPFMFAESTADFQEISLQGRAPTWPWGSRRPCRPSRGCGPWSCS